jgi:4-amino-4-deoxy-L-arabinose transferase-like glycosyltransferase
LESDRGAHTQAHCWYRPVWYAVLLVGIAVRLAYVARPFDYRISNPWRQSDYFAIARNFDREGLNLFYPRVDWRADTPGYAEMELPVLPWVGALLYRMTGPHVQAVRALSGGLEVVALLLFAALASKLLRPWGALFALLAFACNPLLVLHAGALQPEPVLDVCTLTCMALLWRWNERPRPWRLFAAALAAAAAALAKLPGAYLALVMAYVVVRRLGWRALTTASVYAAALVAALPPLLWYVWAHGFWTEYGLSLGVSNESHLIGLDLLLPPMFLLGILAWETAVVFTPAGWFLALAALRLPWRRIELPAVWYAAICVFYVLAARTTADRWAYYYHSLSVPPAALLMGTGLALLVERRAIPVRWGRIAEWQRAIGLALAAATIVGSIAVAAYLIDRRDNDRAYRYRMYSCALELAPLVPAVGLIVAHGGSMSDDRGHPVAHNESMLFAWMDRRGFNYGAEALSTATLEAIAARGGRYWVVEQGELERGDLAAQVDARYRRLATCDLGFALYDLRPR